MSAWNSEPFSNPFFATERIRIIPAINIHEYNNLLFGSGTQR
jgi:hypothetical protein